MKTLIYLAIVLFLLSCKKEDNAPVVETTKADMVGKWVLDSCVNIKADKEKYVSENINNAYYMFSEDYIINYSDRYPGTFANKSTYDFNVTNGKGVIILKYVINTIPCETCIGGFKTVEGTANIVDTVWVSGAKLKWRNSTKIWPETEDYYYTKQ